MQTAGAGRRPQPSRPRARGQPVSALQRPHAHPLAHRGPLAPAPHRPRAAAASPLPAAAARGSLRPARAAAPARRRATARGPPWAAARVLRPPRAAAQALRLPRAAAREALQRAAAARVQHCAAPRGGAPPGSFPGREALARLPPGRRRQLGAPARATPPPCRPRPRPPEQSRRARPRAAPPRLRLLHRAAAPLARPPAPHPPPRATPRARRGRARAPRQTRRCCRAPEQPPAAGREPPGRRRRPPPRAPPRLGPPCRQNSNLTRGRKPSRGCRSRPSPRRNSARHAARPAVGGGRGAGGGRGLTPTGGREPRRSAGATASPAAAQGCGARAAPRARGPPPPRARGPPALPRLGGTRGRRVQAGVHAKRTRGTLQWSGSSKPESCTLCRARRRTWVARLQRFLSFPGPPKRTLSRQWLRAHSAPSPLVRWRSRALGAGAGIALGLLGAGEAVSIQRTSILGRKAQRRTHLHCPQSGKCCLTGIFFFRRTAVRPEFTPVSPPLGMWKLKPLLARARRRAAIR